jgi:hypothetical protein
MDVVGLQSVFQLVFYRYIDLPRNLFLYEFGFGF